MQRRELHVVRGDYTNLTAPLFATVGTVCTPQTGATAGGNGHGPTALHHVTGGHPSTVTQVDDSAVSILRDMVAPLISNGANTHLGCRGARPYRRSRASRPILRDMVAPLISNGARVQTSQTEQNRTELIWEVPDRIVGVGLPRQAVQFGQKRSAESAPRDYVMGQSSVTRLPTSAK